METGYEISYECFQDALADEPFRRQIAGLIRHWLGYKIMPVGDGFAIRDADGADVDPRVVHDAIQADPSAQFSVYQDFMRLYR